MNAAINQTITIEKGSCGAVCLNCKWFYQHYLPCGDGFTETHTGHCAKPRVKQRTLFDTCGYFEPRKEE